MCWRTNLEVPPTTSTFAQTFGVTQPTLIALERHARARMTTVHRSLQLLGAGARLVSVSYITSFHKGAATSSANHNWTTPRPLLATLTSILGRVDLDPCAPEIHAHRTTAHHHITAADNGLLLDWFGNVFLNPPYGRSLPHWIAKVQTESQRPDVHSIIALIPARTDTSYWHRHVVGHAHVWFLQGRLSFGAGSTPAPFPSALIAWKLSAEHAAKLSAKLAAAYVPPTNPITK